MFEYVWDLFGNFVFGYLWANFVGICEILVFLVVVFLDPCDKRLDVFDALGLGALGAAGAVKGFSGVGGKCSIFGAPASGDPSGCALSGGSSFVGSWGCLGDYGECLSCLFDVGASLLCFEDLGNYSFPNVLSPTFWEVRVGLESFIVWEQGMYVELFPIHSVLLLLKLLFAHQSFHQQFLCLNFCQ